MGIQKFIPLVRRVTYDHNKRIAPVQRPPVTEIRNHNLSVVTWALTNVCNNACRYCPSFLHDGKDHPPIDWPNLHEFLQFIMQRFTSERQLVQFSLSGGEPTTHPLFPEIVRTIHQLGGYISLTTNLSRSVHFIEQHFPYLASATCTFHPSYEIPQNRVEHFVEKVEQARLCTGASVRVMMDPLYWHDCIEFISRLQSLNIRVTPVMIEDQYGNSTSVLCDLKYTPEQISFFSSWVFEPPKKHIPPTKKIPLPSYKPHIELTYEDGSTTSTLTSPHEWQTLIDNGQTRFLHYQCGIGVESLFINYTGQIRRANCSVGEWVGTLDRWKDIPWDSLNNFVQCTQKSCTCGGDIPITKYRNK